MKNNIIISSILAITVPVFVFAADDIMDVMDILVDIMNYAIPILITLAVIYFIWSVIQYTLGTDEEAKKGARKGIVTGLIGLFIIISFWGIVRLIQGTFGIHNEPIDKTDLPTVIFN